MTGKTCRLAALLVAGALLIAGLGADDKSRLAILPMGRTEGVEAEEAEQLTERLYLFGQEKYAVLTRKDVEAVLKEQNLWATNLVDLDQDLSKRTGKLLAADKLLVGSVGKLGETYTIHLRIVDAASGRVEAAAAGDHRGKIDGLLDLIQQVASQVFEESGARPIKTRVLLTIECKPGYIFQNYSGIASPYEVYVAAESSSAGGGVGRMVGMGPRGATTANVPSPPPARIQVMLDPGAYRVWGAATRNGQLYETEREVVTLGEGGQNYVVLSGVCKRVKERR